MPELTPKEIRVAVQLWRGDADYAQRQITRLQSICKHGTVVRKPFRIDGYAEPTLYKNDCTCEDCGKNWVENQ